MHFYIKSKVGFIHFYFLHQKLSIWTKLGNKHAVVNGGREAASKGNSSHATRG